MSTGIFSCYAESFAAVTCYFLGNVFGACLYGALTVQLYQYYISFSKDRRAFKVVIYAVYVTETIFTVLLIYDLGASVYEYSVNLGAGALDRVCFKFPTTQIFGVCGGIVAFQTQSMYAYRIRIIMKLKCIPWVIMLVATGQLFALVITCLIYKTETFFYITVVWTSMSMVIDLTITSIMVWFLKKDEIYCKRLKKKIARLIYLILGTGLVTAVTNLCILVLVTIESISRYAYVLLLVYSKLYANSTMVLVNSRIPCARSETNNCVTLDIATIQFHGRSRASATNTEHGQQEISAELDD